MITLFDFQKLNKNNKAETTWDGTYLTTREEGDYQILLYSLGSFYVEIYYQQQINEIIRIEGFSDARRLSPYLEDIMIRSN